MSKEMIKEYSDNSKNFKWIHILVHLQRVEYRGKIKFNFTYSIVMTQLIVWNSDIIRHEL